MHIAIIGPGLIGRSVALAARRAGSQDRITEIDRGQSPDAARHADLIVLATPVDVILDIIAHHADVLRSSVTVDTGSTKRAIVLAARAAGLETFVGGHPMAGGSSSGPDAAREDLFDGRPWFLVPDDATPSAVHTVRGFVERLRARPVVMRDDGSEHDRVMAAVSHLPQVVASALMIVAADAARTRLPWAGAGLRDTTRLAESSAVVWESVVRSNAGQLAPLLRAMARELGAVADELDAGHKLTGFFERARLERTLL